MVAKQAQTHEVQSPRRGKANDIRLDVRSRCRIKISKFKLRTSNRACSSQSAKNLSCITKHDSYDPIGGNGGYKERLGRKKPNCYSQLKIRRWKYQKPLLCRQKTKIKRQVKLNRLKRPKIDSQKFKVLLVDAFAQKRGSAKNHGGL